MRIEKIALSLGGDHGTGAFRLNLKVLIAVRVGEEIEVIRDDIGDVSSVYCKKDTSTVIKNTVLELLKEDLAEFNNSKLILQKDDDGFIQCQLHSGAGDAYPLSSHEVEIKNKDVYVIGDLKWLAMLLGMENYYSGTWDMVYNLPIEESRLARL